MRRIFALFILCILPLQWTYAAVADYCQHETAPAAQQHAGHHDHQHVEPPGDKESSNKGVLDLDCPACHHSTGAAVPYILVDPLPATASIDVIARSCAIPQRAPDNPFRPPLLARA
jgi:hypothetical protein